ncbi:MAG: XdhC family protein [Cyanobacteria bacterium P01_A01_bin.114]
MSLKFHQALYQKLYDQLHEGPVAVATVILTEGRVPASVGHKMLIWGDAETCYSLDGGEAEHAVIQQAFTVLKTGIAQRVKLYYGTGANRGTMHVWLTRWQGEDAIATAHQLIESLDAEPCSPPRRLVIPLVTGQSPFLLTPTRPSLRNLQGGDVFVEELVA